MKQLVSGKRADDASYGKGTGALEGRLQVRSLDERARVPGRRDGMRLPVDGAAREAWNTEDDGGAVHDKARVVHRSMGSHNGEVGKIHVVR